MIEKERGNKRNKRVARTLMIHRDSGSRKKKRITQSDREEDRQNDANKMQVRERERM